MVTDAPKPEPSGLIHRESTEGTTDGHAGTQHYAVRLGKVREFATDRLPTARRCRVEVDSEKSENRRHRRGLVGHSVPPA